MSKLLFVASHQGSGYQNLIDGLTKHPNIDYFKTNQIYDEFDKIEYLIKQPHKKDNAAAIYVDVLLFNHSFCRKLIHEDYKFIILVREPSATLGELKDYPSAILYYQLRIHGLYELSKRTKSVIFNWNNLSELESFLGMKVVVTPPTTKGEIISPDCQYYYDKYFKS
jgi:hypothetical protein